MGKRVRLHPRQLETTASIASTLARFTNEATAGDLVGLVAIPLYRAGEGPQYTLALSGWASTHPTFALGTMSACMALMREIALTEAGVLPTV